MQTGLPQNSNPDETHRLTLPRRPLRWLVWILAASVLLAGGGLLSQRQSPLSTAAGKPGRRGQDGAIPVSVATVQQGNMGDYINTLGTVTSVYTVTLTSRVAGALV